MTNREPEKCAALDWHLLDGFPQNVVPYVRRTLENHRSGKWFDTFGWDDEAWASPVTPPR